MAIRREHRPDILGDAFACSAPPLMRSEALADWEESVRVGFGNLMLWVLGEDLPL